MAFANGVCLIVRLCSGQIHLLRVIIALHSVVRHWGKWVGRCLSVPFIQQLNSARGGHRAAIAEFQAAVRLLRRSGIGTNIGMGIFCGEARFLGPG